MTESNNDDDRNYEKLLSDMSDEDIVLYCQRGNISHHLLERITQNCTRAVRVRRLAASKMCETRETSVAESLSKLPYENYDWDRILGACCENVIGYVPIPVGIAGPILVDGKRYVVPMATTEGGLVASTNRGCKAVCLAGGVSTALSADGMTRGPCVEFPTVQRACDAKTWIESADGQAMMKTAFESTTRFARLQSVKAIMAGTSLYTRFTATTGDAMGMNMMSKGVECALKTMITDGGFDDMRVISLTGNYCVDKKCAAINWINGRGKSVVAEATIPNEVLRTILKVDAESLVELNVSKNLVGSAMAGSIGGFNTHAANIVTAIYIATGQDPAQVVGSSNCLTLMKRVGNDLHISVTMPSLELGTLGGGTKLGPQGAMLDLLGVQGSDSENIGENARTLARVIAAATLAGELSTCSALVTGHLFSKSRLQQLLSTLRNTVVVNQPSNNIVMATATETQVLTTEAVPSHLPETSTTSEAFTGHDQEQIRLMSEMCIVVDYDDKPIGSLSKKSCHLMTNVNEGLIHRAFSVILFNEKNELLLQQRASEKITFPNLWSNTCCSHPLAIRGETGSTLTTAIEGARRAAQRKLEHELGISKEQATLDKFNFLTRMYYKAASDGIWGEHEITYIFIIKANVNLNLNKNEVQNTAYVSADELKRRLEESPDEFTPWFRLFCKFMLFDWWEGVKNDDLERHLNNQEIRRM
ncbi:hypothetical protein CP532_0619 [Ophiocordyceps camponoti-leonardi (nom. inval.)]|nr:hypothetical protein CP532_0619 [Ophiocordyceps camponoti-leonardi (nom. inval.)]